MSTINKTIDCNSTKEHATASLCYDKVPKLIRCNKGRSCECMVAKKRFIKTQSSDSGGSFDSIDNTESVGATVVANNNNNNNNDNVLATTRSQKSKVLTHVVNCKSSSLEQNLSTSDSEQYCDPSSLKNNKKMPVNATNNFSKSVENSYSNEIICETNRPSRTSLEVTTESQNISLIFSKLAKDKVCKKPIYESLKRATSLSGPEFFKVSNGSGDPSMLADHLMKECDLDEQNMNVFKSDHDAHTNRDSNDSTTAIDMYCDEEMLQGLPTEGGNDKWLRRSLSDSGSSTGSHELSDSEKTSLTNINKDVRKSIVSLDMGISVTSFESLGEKSYTDYDDSTEDRQRLQTSIGVLSSDEELDRPCLDTRMNTFLARVKCGIETLSVDDADDLFLEVESDTNDTLHRSGILDLSERSNSTEFTDLYLLADDDKVHKGENFNLESDGYLVYRSETDASTTPVPVSPPLSHYVKKKRDFHLWEQDIVDICQCEPNLYRLASLNVPSGSNDCLSVVNITANLPIGLPNSECVSSATYDEESPFLSLNHSDNYQSEINSETITDNFESDRLQQTMTMSPVNSPNRPRRRRVGVCSNIDSGSLINLEQQTLSNDKSLLAASTHATTPSIRTSTSTIPSSNFSTIDESYCTHYNTYPQNAIGPVPTNKVSINANKEELKNKQKRLSHANYKKTVESALRRISNPTKSFQMPNIFGSNKYKYDLELASLASSTSYPSTPDKPDRSNRLLQSFSSSSKPSSPPTSATLRKVTPHQKDIASAIKTPPPPSQTRLSMRFRSFSVDTCSPDRKQLEHSGQADKTSEYLYVSSSNLQDSIDYQLQDGNDLLLDEL